MSLVVCIRKKQALARFSIFADFCLFCFRAIFYYSGLARLAWASCASADLSGFALRLTLAL